MVLINNQLGDYMITQNDVLNKVQQKLYHGFNNLRLILEGKYTLEEFIVNSIEVLLFMLREDCLQTARAEGIKDKANGTYTRLYHALTGRGLSIKIPRTRLNRFHAWVVDFFVHSQESINQLVLSLYIKGVTTRDISSLLEEFFGEKMSYVTINQLAKQFYEYRRAWENSMLEKHYKIAYCDALYITVKRGNSYAKEAVHVMFGVRDDNKRELLALYINPVETANSWETGLAHIQARGVDAIDLIIADGVSHLEDMIHRYYPGTQFQKCVVHKMRNVLNSIRPAHKAEVAHDLKHVFNHFESHSTLDDAKTRLQSFIQKWQSTYTNIARFFPESTVDYYFTYINFPSEYRRMIYTTNSIENLNKKIRKATKNKLSFDCTERLLDYVFMIVKEFEEQNWMKYPMSPLTGWPKWTQET